MSGRLSLNRDSASFERRLSVHVHPYRLSAAARTVSAGNDHSLQIPFYNSAQIAEATLSVSYDGQPVSNGSKMLPSATSKQPEVKYKGTETYTLMLIDPDVPSAAKPINRNL